MLSTGVHRFNAAITSPSRGLTRHRSVDVQMTGDHPVDAKCLCSLSRRPCEGRTRLAVVKEIADLGRDRFDVERWDQTSCVTSDRPMGRDVRRHDWTAPRKSLEQRKTKALVDRGRRNDRRQPVQRVELLLRDCTESDDIRGVELFFELLGPPTVWPGEDERDSEMAHANTLKRSNQAQMVLARFDCSDNKDEAAGHTEVAEQRSCVRGGPVSWSGHAGRDGMERVGVETLDEQLLSSVLRRHDDGRCSLPGHVKCARVEPQSAFREGRGMAEEGYVIDGDDQRGARRRHGKAGSVTNIQVEPNSRRPGSVP